MNKKLIRLLLGLIDGLDHEIENTKMKDIFKLQKKEQDKILEQVADITLKYTVVDNMLDIPVTERRLLKQKVSATIDKATKTGYKNEIKVMNKLLETNAVERYAMNTYFYGKTFKIDYKLKQLPNKKIKEIIDYKVKSEIWSDRLWRHKKELNKKLRKDIYNLLDGKTNVNNIAEDISNKYKQSFNRSRTLVRTETTRVQAEVNEEWSNGNGIEQQLFVATLDDRTSEECEEHDGEMFDIDDSSKPVPPLHPNCRSVLVNIPFEGWSPKTRIDNITKQNINYVDYKEWKDKQ